MKEYTDNEIQEIGHKEFELQYGDEEMIYFVEGFKKAINVVNKNCNLPFVMPSAVKPPLGLPPKDIWERNKRVDRLNEVREAIARYYDAGLKIKVEWIEEYNELIELVCGG